MRIVKDYYRNQRESQLDNYLAMITTAKEAVGLTIDLSHFNEHDFANVQRAAWLTIVRAITRLVALNPFDPDFKETNPWLNPAGHPSVPEVSAERNPHLFFGVPNPTGWFALTSRDFDLYWGVLPLPHPTRRHSSAS